MAVRGDTEDRRWDRAHRIAAGFPDEQVRQAYRRQLILIYVLLAAIIVGGAILGVIAGSSRRRGRSAGHADLSSLHVELRLVFDILGLVFLVIGLVMLVRARRRLRWIDSPLAALKSGERRAIVKQVMGRGPDYRHRVDIAYAVATRLSHRQLNPMLYLGLALVYLGTALGTPTAVHIIRLVYTAALFGLVAVISQRQLRKARTYVEHHSPPTGQLVS